jgi:hypothetical protein
MRLGRAHEEEKPPQIFWSPTKDANRRPVHARRHKELRRALARARWLAVASTWWPAGPATLDPSTSARLQGLSQRPPPPVGAAEAATPVLAAPTASRRSPASARLPSSSLSAEPCRPLPVARPTRRRSSGLLCMLPLPPDLLDRSSSGAGPLPSEGSPRRVGRAPVRFRLAVPAVPPRRLLRAHHYDAINLHPWGETTRFCIVVRLAGKMRVLSTYSIGARFRYPNTVPDAFLRASCCWR